jgi:hypothetical protein
MLLAKSGSNLHAPTLCVIPGADATLQRAPEKANLLDEPPRGAVQQNNLFCSAMDRPLSHCAVDSRASDFHHRLTVMSKKRTTILCVALVVLVAIGILISGMLTVTNSNTDLKLSFIGYTNNVLGVPIALIELHNTGSAAVLPCWGNADGTYFGRGIPQTPLPQKMLAGGARQTVGLPYSTATPRHKFCIYCSKCPPKFRLYQLALRLRAHRFLPKSWRENMIATYVVFVEVDGPSN